MSSLNAVFAPAEGHYAAPQLPVVYCCNKLRTCAMVGRGQLLLSSHEGGLKALAVADFTDLAAWWCYFAAASSTADFWNK